MKRQYLLNVFLFTATLLSGCFKKKLPECNFGCIDLVIEGRIAAKPDGSGIKDIPIEASWNGRGFCLGICEYPIGKTVTGIDGTFRITRQVDTGFFKNNILSVETRSGVGNSYFLAEGPVNQHTYGSDFSVTFDKLDRQAMMKCNLLLYRKTTLTIHLQRRRNDDFALYSLETAFPGRYTDYTHQVQGQQLAADRTLTIQTVAGAYTTIRQIKLKTQGKAESKSDSILCTVNGPNVITLEY